MVERHELAEATVVANSPAAGQASSDVSPSPSWRKWAAAAVIACVAFGLFPLLLQGFYHDDYGLIHQVTMRSWWEVFDPGHPEGVFHYAPLRLAIFSLIFSLFGPAPWPYHALSLLGQILFCLAWYRLAARFCATWVIRIAMTAGLAFLPLASEAIFSVGANDHPIAGAAYLWALVSFIEYRDSGRTRPAVMTVAAYTFGIFVSEMTITLPLILISIVLKPDWWELRPSIRPIKRYMSCLIPLAAITVIYLGLHLAAADPRAFEDAGYTMRPGAHNLRNLFFGARVAVLTPTLLLGSGAPDFWGHFSDTRDQTVFAIFTATAFAAVFIIPRTRILGAWLVLSLLPYIWKTHNPQGGRYYHLPTAILLLAVVAVLGSVTTRWKVLGLPAAACLVPWAGMCMHTWYGEEGFYRGMSEAGEVAVDQIARKVPESLGQDMSVIVINSLPFPVRYVICGAMQLHFFEHPEKPGGFVYRSDLEDYWEQQPEPTPPDYEWLVPTNAVLMDRDPYRHLHELDGVVPLIRSSARTEHSITWNLMLPSPAALVWRHGSDANESSCLSSDATALLEEYEPSRLASAPIRNWSLILSFGSGRIRIPRPAGRNTWYRLRVTAEDPCGIDFDYLAIEAL